MPTLLVLAAVAAMIALGVWQLHRRQWKEGLLASWSAARTMPPVAWPTVPPADDSLIYRRADGFCLAVTGFSARAGEDRRGNPGWRHLAACRTGAEGPGMLVDIGWSRTPDAPPRWIGGKVSGIIGRDRDRRILLVADQAAPGLAPSAYPDPNEEPNNHLTYAVQWFSFAAIALIIYVIALIQRWKREDAGKTG
nr:SURF1 family protein [Sphingomonas quercus]